MFVTATKLFRVNATENLLNPVTQNIAIGDITVCLTHGNSGSFYYNILFIILLHIVKLSEKTHIIMCLNQIKYSSLRYNAV